MLQAARGTAIARTLFALAIVAAIVAAIAATAGPVAAQDDDGLPSAQPAPVVPADVAARRYAPAVAAMVHDVIVPQHAAFVEAAIDAAHAVADLCVAPAPEALVRARTKFAALVAAFGRIEAYRFGPARENNRFEKIFYWPDRRGRGQRQVETLIAAEDPAALDPEALRDKSVAVVGLTALEFALYGDDDALLRPDAYRCRYGAAVAIAIASTATELEAGWRGPFGAAMLNAGDPGSAYRSHAEALQDILAGAAELLQIDADLKLGESVIGDAAGEGNPKLAPFWRSGQTVALLLANADGVAALAGPPLETLLGGDSVAARAARFELAQVRRGLSPVATADIVAAAADDDGHRHLAFARSPFAAAQRLFAIRIPGDFGFVTGFNALDGD